MNRSRPRPFNELRRLWWLLFRTIGTNTVKDVRVTEIPPLLLQWTKVLHPKQTLRWQHRKPKYLHAFVAGCCTSHLLFYIWNAWSYILKILSTSSLSAAFIMASRSANEKSPSVVPSARKVNLACDCLTTTWSHSPNAFDSMMLKNKQKSCQLSLPFCGCCCCSFAQAASQDSPLGGESGTLCVSRCARKLKNFVHSLDCVQTSTRIYTCSCHGGVLYYSVWQIRFFTKMPCPSHGRAA